MARIDERVKALLLVVDEVRTLLAQQNGRVGSLERWRAYLTGAIAIVSLAFGLAMTVVLGKL